MNATVKPKRPRRHVYMKWRVMVDPRTGEELRALVASSEVDRKILRARKFRADGRVRVEIRNPRNEGFHRLVHTFGQFLILHVHGYERHGNDAHAAVKDVQARSGAACEVQRVDIDIPGHGLTEVAVNVPRSISFDEMDEDEFDSAFQIMVDYVAENDYPNLSREQVQSFQDLVTPP